MSVNWQIRVVFLSAPLMGILRSYVPIHGKKHQESYQQVIRKRSGEENRRDQERNKKLQENGNTKYNMQNYMDFGHCINAILH